MKSINQKISKVRKPRVHISYEVDGSDGPEKKELPFVVGVLGDYSGDNKVNLGSLKDRKFVEIDAGNFEAVMQKMTPKVNLKVQNCLTDEGKEMAVELEFNCMEDFEPEGVAKQVPALKKLLDTREKLKDLLSKADRSEDLELLLEEILQDSEKLAKITGELTEKHKEQTDVES